MAGHPGLPLWTMAVIPCKGELLYSSNAKCYLTVVNTQGQQCPWGGLQATLPRISEAHLMENSGSPREHLSFQHPLRLTLPVQPFPQELRWQLGAMLHGSSTAARAALHLQYPVRTSGVDMEGFHGDMLTHDAPPLLEFSISGLWPASCDRTPLGSLLTATETGCPATEH